MAEDQMLECIKQIIKEHHLVGCAIGSYPCDGICLNKECEEWVVSVMSRNEVDQICGRFPRLFDASLFFVDQLFPSFQEGASAKGELCNLWGKNVLNFMNI